MKVMDAKAYWINPDGKLFSVRSSHINEVVSSPESFELTQKYIADTFNKYHEPIGLEGNARHEIMTGIIEKGWVRIRYYAKRDLYSVELNKLTQNIKGYLWEWAKGIFEVNDKRQYSTVRIIEFSDDFKMYQCSIEELIKEVLYSDSEKAAIRKS